MDGSITIDDSKSINPNTTIVSNYNVVLSDIAMNHTELVNCIECVMEFLFDIIRQINCRQNWPLDAVTYLDVFKPWKNWMGAEAIKAGPHSDCKCKYIATSLSRAELSCLHESQILMTASVLGNIVQRCVFIPSWFSVIQGWKINAIPCVGYCKVYWLCWPPPPCGGLYGINWRSWVIWIVGAGAEASVTAGSTALYRAVLQ